MATDSTRQGRDSNPDPITGAPGSHPVATGVGAAAAGAAGAAIGSVVPGVGTVIGGVIGAIAGSVGGGAAGHAVGEAIDPTGTDTYWKENYKSRPYVQPGSSYDDLKPAYATGASLAQRGDTTHFDETVARTEWQATPASKLLPFERAKAAMQDEFNRCIQLREEQLRVNKERVSAGEVSLRKEVTSETKSVQVPVEREELVITRHAATGATARGDIGDDQEIRVPLSEERVNMSKETVVTGEVEVGKRKVTDTQTVTGEVRKESLKVDNAGNAKIVDERNA